MASEAPFTVIHFALEMKAEQPTQRSATCGTFGSVEAAFDNARHLATTTLGQLRQSHANDAPNFVDTEWGYDIRLGPLTVHRFWVHENHRTQRTLA